MTAFKSMVVFLTIGIPLFAGFNLASDGEEGASIEGPDIQEMTGDFEFDGRNLNVAGAKVDTKFQGNTPAKNIPFKKNISETNGQKDGTESPGKDPPIPPGCLQEPTYLHQGAVERRKFNRLGYPVVIEYGCKTEGTEKYTYVTGTTEARCDTDGKWTLPALICLPTTCTLQGERRGKNVSLYVGEENKTKSNRKCQKWIMRSPHNHLNTLNSAFPYDSSVDSVSNTCRDPDMEGRPWCYTLDPKKRWEFCDVPDCKKVVKCGLPPHMPGTRPIKTEIDGSEVIITYRCHDSLVFLGNEKTATCDLVTGTWKLPDMLCASMECFYVGNNGNAIYKGGVSVTKSGRTCQRFDSNSPHKHHMEIKPEFHTTVAGIGARCQDVMYKAVGVPWCYTMDPGKRWEPCAIRECNLHGLP